MQIWCKQHNTPLEGVPMLVPIPEKEGSWAVSLNTMNCPEESQTHELIWGVPSRIPVCKEAWWITA